LAAYAGLIALGQIAFHGHLILDPQ